MCGLPHTQTTRWWSTCAFTSKMITTAAALRLAGHKVVVYSGEENDAPCDEHVTVVTAEDRARWFGEETWEGRVFDHWDLTDPCWVELNDRLTSAVAERYQEGDVVSLTMGLAHKQVADALPGALCAELGIGYEASFAPYRVFESSAWMHHTYGRQGIHDGRFYDAVIPNAYFPDDFELREQKDGYLLFMGRLTPRKGLATVAEIAKHRVVVTAGQGEERIPGAEHVGVVRGRDRIELLAGARALLCPTGYIEPFGGVAVEAQLSGTPVITVPWGAFVEVVEEGVSGFHCHTLAEFLDAVDRVGWLNPRLIRERAVERWSVEAVSPQYGRYLNRLATLLGDGWYAGVRRS